MGVNDRCVITWHGVSSESLGVVVEGYPSAAAPERDREIVSVIGRNGSLVINKKSRWANVVQKITMHWEAANHGAVMAWLFGTDDGYQRFEDSFHLGYYQLGIIDGETKITNYANVLYRAEVSFNFKPQFFLNSGDTPISVTNNQIIANPGFEVFPLIEATPTANTRATISFGADGANNPSMAFVNVPSGGIILDCELQDAWRPNTSISLNSFVQAPDGFCSLVNGSNKITFTNMSNVKITPRWWTIL